MTTPSKIRSFPIEPHIAEARNRKLAKSRKRNAERNARNQRKANGFLSILFRDR